MRSGFVNITGHVDPREPPRPLVGWRLKRSDLLNVLLATGIVFAIYLAAGAYDRFFG